MHVLVLIHLMALFNMVITTQVFFKVHTDEKNEKASSKKREKSVGKYVELLGMLLLTVVMMMKMLKRNAMSYGSCYMIFDMQDCSYVCVCVSCMCGVHSYERF